MALHDPSPVAARIKGWVLGLRADGGRVEECFSPKQRTAARGFWEPLIPANAGTERAVAGLPNREAGIAWREIELLAIARAIGNVRFAVVVHHRAVGVDHDERVEERVRVPLEIAHGQHDLKLRSEGGESADHRVVFARLGEVEVAVLLGLAKVRSCKEFLEEDDVRATVVGLADDLFGLRKIRLDVPRQGHLRGGEGDVASHSKYQGRCWCLKTSLVLRLGGGPVGR